MITDLDTRPHVVYRLLDATGMLLYIGMTVDVPTRWADHEQRQPWWPMVAAAITEDHPHRPAATRAERRAIWQEAPLHNVTHNFDNIMNRRQPAGWPIASTREGC